MPSKVNYHLQENLALFPTGSSERGIFEEKGKEVRANRNKSFSYTKILISCICEGGLSARWQ